MQVRSVRVRCARSSSGAIATRPNVPLRARSSPRKIAVGSPLSSAGSFAAAAATASREAAGGPESSRAKRITATAAMATQTVTRTTNARVRRSVIERRPRRSQQDARDEHRDHERAREAGQGGAEPGQRPQRSEGYGGDQTGDVARGREQREPAGA